MTRILLSVCLAAVVCAPAQQTPDPGLKKLLQQVERRYNSARTIQVEFEQSVSAPGRPRRTEKGALTLRKPGRMRWDYTSPQGKLFLSDGKHIYYYSPATNRAEKTKLKESEDLRAPLAFLLGKLDFDRDFRNYQSRTDHALTVINAEPKNNRLPYRAVEFTLGPSAEIQKLVVTGQDNSISEFRFDNERVNVAVNDSAFKFQLPPGARLVESATVEEQP
ncbi:MAG: outer membrane lipoprotein carrier protein LolA [Bryobacteraceae bacterium]|nr:outer membrane lipoprotein carrier protein LolA [Bryobacteraceae bacterium]